MAYQQKDNSGSVFKNDRKRPGKKDADYTGSAVVGGVEYWVDQWINNNPRDPDYDPNKKTFMSIKFRPKNGQGDTRAPDRRQTQPQPPRRRAPLPPGREQHSPTALHDRDQEF